VDFTGKTVIHTTSAGTQGIANATDADEIIAGNLVAAKAIARYIRAKNPEYVSLVCMGLAGGRQTDEDELCGKYLKALIEGAPLQGLAHQINRLKYTDGAKFFEPKRQEVFPERDYHLATAVDTCNFILRLKKDDETGLCCMERIDIPPVDTPNPVTPVESGAMMSNFSTVEAMHLPDNVKASIVYGHLKEQPGNFDAALVLGGNPDVMPGRAKAASKLWKEGRCGVLYNLVLSYECADWDAINRYAEELGIPKQMITSLYFICVDNVNVLWEQLTQTSPKLEN
jgi:hypothetical protein